MATRRRSNTNPLAYQAPTQPSFPDQVSPLVAKANNGLAGQLRAGAKRRIKR